MKFYLKWTVALVETVFDLQKHKRPKGFTPNTCDLPLPEEDFHYIISVKHSPHGDYIITFRILFCLQMR